MKGVFVSELFRENDDTLLRAAPSGQMKNASLMAPERLASGTKRQYHKADR